MTGKKTYSNVRLSPNLFSRVRDEFATVMRDWEAVEAARLSTADRERYDWETPEVDYYLTISRKDETWDYESLDEFSNMYSAGYDSFCFDVIWRSRLPKFFHDRLEARIQTTQGGKLLAEISMPYMLRENARRLLRTIDENAELPSNRAPSKTTKVFIGHGRAEAWRELQNDLRDKHGLEILAFESGARSGHAVRDVISEMLEEADFALLVMTAEDELADQTMRARQNVIHEAGLFQGKLGYRRAIMLVEEGVENFSNVDGIVYLGFKPGQIRSLVGDILATLRREGLF